MDPRGRGVVRSMVIARALFVGVMAVGAALIAWTCLPYFDPEALHPFVLEKLPVPLEDVWLFALKVHVVSALLSLPACLVLMSRRLLRAAPRVHRLLGRVNGAVILLGLAPSGLWLALFAKGGGLVTAGFALSSTIVVVAMVGAIRSARARDYVAHRRLVAHVVAQMSVAVTSRALLIGLDAAGVEPGLAYVVALWIPVLASAGIAALVTRRTRPAILVSTPTRSSHESHAVHRFAVGPAR